MAPDGRQTLTYLVGATLSYVGTAIVPVAMSFAVLDAGYGAGELGLVLAAQTVPTIILLLPGGILGDRWSRRGIMISADFFRALAQSVLAGFLIEGRASLVLMVAVSILIGTGNAFFQPASGGFLTEIVARQQLGRTNGLLRAANALALVIGPLVGGVVVVAIGPGWGIALDAGSYFASAFCLLAIRPAVRVTPATIAKQAVVQQMKGALKAIRQTRWLWLILIQFGFLNMIAIAPFMVIAPVVLSRTPVGAGAWGTLLSGIGSGAVVGALGCARRQPRRMLLGLEAAAAMLSVPILLLAMQARFPLIVAGGVIFGVGAAMLSVLTVTAIQREIAPSMLSQTMAIVQLAGMGLNLLGYVLAGPVMGLLGAPIGLASSGFCILASVAILCSQPEIRQFEARPS